MKNKVNNTSSGAVFRGQSIIKWLLLLLLGMQLASFVSNLTVSLLLGGGGPLGSSFRMSWSDTDDEFNTVIEANLLRSLMNGSTEYRGVKLYTQYAITYERLIKNRNPFVRVVKKKIVIKEVNDVTSFKYPIDIGPCKIRDKGLFIGVVSSPPNFKRRRDIRRTWLRHLNDKRMMEANSSVNIVGFGFILGQTNDTQVQTRIEKESRTHGDILQVQIMDEYFDLAVKGVAFYNWLNNNCAGVNFVLKVDDDVYVNIRQLVSLLKQPPFSTSSFSSDVQLYGFNQTAAAPKRDESKWKVSWDLWPWKTYPSYLFGPSILIPGGEGVRRLLEAAKTTPYFRIDDVYLNGILPEKAKMSLNHVDRFYCPSAPEEPSECYARWAATWLTESSWHMRTSNTAVERLYLHNEMRQQCNWTMDTGCQSFFYPVVDENVTHINTTGMQVDAQIFFNLLDKYVEAQAKIANLTGTSSIPFPTRN